MRPGEGEQHAEDDQVEHDPARDPQERRAAVFDRVDPVEMAVHLVKGRVHGPAIEQAGQPRVAHPVLRAKQRLRGTALTPRQPAPGAADLALEVGTADAEPLRESRPERLDPLIEPFRVNHLRGDPRVAACHRAGVVIAGRRRYTRPMLNMIDHGGPADKPGLLIVHGLYGSARNWGVIAKRLSQTRRVVAVDLRNHGASPWFDTHTYPEMAEDLAEVIGSLGGTWDVMGHSMGGKAAMVLALTRPELVNRLIVVDIAPVAYGHSQIEYVEAMKSVDLSGVTRRSEAGEQLAERIDTPELVPFFLQSLDVKAKRWMLNLDALGANMDAILGFPDIAETYEGDTLFLGGGASEYVAPEHAPRIEALFPAATIERLAGAGHWLHAEKPREFEEAVRGWLDGGGHDAST